MGHLVQDVGEHCSLPIQSIMPWTSRGKLQLWRTKPKCFLFSSMPHPTFFFAFPINEIETPVEWPFAWRDNRWKFSFTRGREENIKTCFAFRTIEHYLPAFLAFLPICEREIFFFKGSFVAFPWHCLLQFHFCRVMTELSRTGPFAFPNLCARGFFLLLRARLFLVMNEIWSGLLSHF